MSLFDTDTREREKKCMRKPERLKEAFWTVEEIKKYWDENNLNTQNWIADTITRKFRAILETIGLKDEIEWYCSESSTGGCGKFIFSGKGAPEKMRELFDIFYGNKGLVVTEEKNRIADILGDMLPFQRSMEGLCIFYQEVEKIERKKKNNEKVEMDDYSRIDEINFYNERKEKVQRIVYEFAMDELDFFIERIFVRIDGAKIPSKIRRQEIYAFQYGQIEGWRDKWKSIMEDAAAVRIAERFENGYDECIKQELDKEERQAFYEKGEDKKQKLQDVFKNSDWIRVEDLYEALSALYENIPSEKLTEEGKAALNAKGDRNIRKNCKEWLDECCGLVNEILKNKLKDISLDDFDYIKKCAFQDLESICCKIRREQNKGIYCSEVKNRTAGDLEKLSRIREMVESKTRTILDFMHLYN